MQLRSWLSQRSYQRHLFAVPAFQQALDRTLSARRFDVVFVNLPYLAHYHLRCSPPGASAPAVVIDSHDVGYDLAQLRAAYAALVDRAGLPQADAEAMQAALEAGLTGYTYLEEAPAL